ncbi:MAG: glycoside hydrolase family 88 protein [Pirellulaceae bacterium]
MPEKAPGDPRTKPTVEEWAVNELKAIRLPVGREGSFIYIDPRWMLSKDQIVGKRSEDQTPTFQFPNSYLPRILILGGTDGSIRSKLDALALYSQLGGGRYHSRYIVACIPAVDARSALFWGKAEDAPVPRNLHLGYPPQGEAYHDAEDSRRHAVWRMIGALAPDVVVEVLNSEPGVMTEEQRKMRGKPLSIAVSGTRVAGVERIMGMTNIVDGKEIKSIDQPDAIHRLIFSRNSDSSIFSPASMVMQNRLARRPADVVPELLSVYGLQLPEVHYIPALALHARLRWGLDTGNDAQVERVVKLVSENLRLKPEAPIKNGSQLAGHLLLAKLARTEHPAISSELQWQTKQAVLRAADLCWDEQGELLPVMPFHNEMSDAVFMAGPLLVEAYHLKGDKAYLEMADRNLRQIQAWCLREDGLYRHSPLDDAAWGRGNGFPALGLAWMLDELPPNDPRYDTWLKMYQHHMAALAAHQNKLGMWHQVIDKLDSYQEYTATCMIAWAMSRGVRNGWLEKKEYTPRIERAWQAILRRTGSDGHLIDVCTGTGKQKDLEAYYNRTAILGRDDRGGAMGLLLAVEMAAWPEE